MRSPMASAQAADAALINCTVPRSHDTWVASTVIALLGKNRRNGV
jgi:hypothetical protein